MRRQIARHRRRADHSPAPHRETVRHSPSPPPVAPPRTRRRSRRLPSSHYHAKDLRYRCHGRPTGADNASHFSTVTHQPRSTHSTHPPPNPHPAPAPPEIPDKSGRHCRSHSPPRSHSGYKRIRHKCCQRSLHICLVRHQLTACTSESRHTAATCSTAVTTNRSSRSFVRISATRGCTSATAGNNAVNPGSLVSSGNPALVRSSTPPTSRLAGNPAIKRCLRPRQHGAILVQPRQHRRCRPRKVHHLIGHHHQHRLRRLNRRDKHRAFRPRQIIARPANNSNPPRPAGKARQTRSARPRTRPAAQTPHTAAETAWQGPQAPPARQAGTHRAKTRHAAPRSPRHRPAGPPVAHHPSHTTSVNAGLPPEPGPGGTPKNPHSRRRQLSNKLVRSRSSFALCVHAAAFSVSRFSEVRRDRRLQRRQRREILQRHRNLRRRQIIHPVFQRAVSLKKPPRVEPGRARAIGRISAKPANIGLLAIGETSRCDSRTSQYVSPSPSVK